MGVTVRQKVKGRGKPWWVFVAHNGKRKSKQVGDKEAAEKVASAIRTKIKKGDFGIEDDNPIPTFKHYADLWIKHTVPANCKSSTLSDYKDILRNHVRPIFDELPITEITRKRIKHFLLSKVNEGFANSTVTHFKNVVSGILNEAVDDVQGNGFEFEGDINAHMTWIAFFLIRDGIYSAYQHIESEAVA